MATDKLVDFDHVTDYISREAAKEAFCVYMGFTSMRASVAADCIFDAIPASDVRPEAEISDAVYEAMYYLNSVSSQMPYHVYSALFDLILGILPTCGADMRPNLDATKGDSHD